MSINFKKFLTIFVAIVMCFVFFSCAAKGDDFTVNLEFIDTDKNVVAQSISGIPDFLYIYDDASELSEVSPIIVIGSVSDVNYTDTNARPTTIYDFKIDQCLRGEFSPNDIISVEEYGGYVRGNVYAEVFGNAKFEKPLTDEDIIIFGYRGGAPAPEIGDEYILFLAESDIIEGAYSLLGSYMGKYVIAQNNTVSRHDPDNTLTEGGLISSETVTSPLKVDDIINSVEETAFNSQLYNERFGPRDIS